MNCPVCHSTNARPCITIENSPIYQHPVTDPSVIPAPYAVSLYYQQCDDCSHVYQIGDHRDLLEKIYSHHYYTPPPSNLGTTFRDDFLYFLKQNNLNKTSISSVLEVGSSSGEMLATLKDELAISCAEGFEPSIESTQAAKAKGLTIYSDFFTTETVKKICNTYDLIYSRHVIEHIFNFEDFFQATNAVSHDKTHLIIETPSLDWAITNNSTIAFHIEHIHVFSEFSLIHLANQFGWFKAASTVTSSGNLITSFTKSNFSTNQIKKPENIAGLQLKNQAVWADISKMAKDKKIILWGAGSCGISLMSSANVKPDYLVDGNRDKAGKYFCGIEQAVEYAPSIIKNLIAKDEDFNFLLIISSSFYREIQENIAKLGWRGEIYIPEIF